VHTHNQVKCDVYDVKTSPTIQRILHMKHAILLLWFSIVNQGLFVETGVFRVL